LYNILISLRLRWYGHVEIMQNQRMPKQIANNYNGRNKEKRKITKGRRDEPEEDLNITESETRRHWPETVWNGGRLYWNHGLQRNLALEEKRTGNYVSN
jgi:hypothetical protein